MTSHMTIPLLSDEALDAQVRSKEQKQLDEELRKSMDVVDFDQLLFEASDSPAIPLGSPAPPPSKDLESILAPQMKPVCLVVRLSRCCLLMRSSLVEARTRTSV